MHRRLLDAMIAVHPTIEATSPYLIAGSLDGHRRHGRRQ